MNLTRHAVTAAGLRSPFDDTSTIPGWQRRLHFYSELAAILLLPKLYAAAKDARPPHKKFLNFMFWGTVVVDGYLLYRWLSDPALKSEAQHVRDAIWAAGSVQNPPLVGAGAPQPQVPQLVSVQPRVVILRPAR